jgi:hypothetical protein
MGTNYYLKKNICECCNRSDVLHVGKSSAGWNFNLRVYKDEGIDSLEDWKREFALGRIVDECNREVTFDEMIDEITNRSRKDGKPLLSMIDYTDAWGMKPFVGRGRHGEGTWDYCEWEFS